ncbi:hypothetical protein WJX72_003031 [[Myrmecia] bisecta]|uniref:Uncharacterized protein n=1 Tax=[Myrmecia] bisecta TaxID=41462 RepID=A0AAW1Q3I4_9CHLO
MIQRVPQALAEVRLLVAAPLEGGLDMVAALLEGGLDMGAGSGTVQEASRILATSFFHRRCLSPALVSQAQTISSSKPPLLYCRSPAGICSMPTTCSLA